MANASDNCNLGGGASCKQPTYVVQFLASQLIEIGSFAGERWEIWVVENAYFIGKRKGWKTEREGEASCAGTNFWGRVQGTFTYVRTYVAENGRSTPKKKKKKKNWRKLRERTKATRKRAERKEEAYKLSFSNRVGGELSDRSVSIAGQFNRCHSRNPRPRQNSSQNNLCLGAPVPCSWRQSLLPN